MTEPDFDSRIMELEKSKSRWKAVALASLAALTILLSAILVVILGTRVAAEQRDHAEQMARQLRDVARQQAEQARRAAEQARQEEANARQKAGQVK